MTSNTLPPSVPSRRAEAGFGLLDAIIALVLLALGLLGLSSGALSEHRLARDQEERTRAHQAVRQLVERMRADDDWPGLFGRLAVRQTTYSGPGGSAYTLDDGRFAYPPTTYFPDYVAPTELGTTAVLIEVPVRPGSEALPVLSEDLSAPAFDLPADLNGDGTIDGNSRNLDYFALPVRITFRWSRENEGGRELFVATWLRGER